MLGGNPPAILATVFVILLFLGDCYSSDASGVDHKVSGTGSDDARTLDDYVSDLIKHLPIVRQKEIIGEFFRKLRRELDGKSSAEESREEIVLRSLRELLRQEPGLENQLCSGEEYGYGMSAAMFVGARRLQGFSYSGDSRATVVDVGGQIIDIGKLWS